MQMADASPENDLYNEFKNDVRSFIRATKRYLKQGGEMTDVELSTALDRLFITFANDLDDLYSPKAHVWLSKAEAFLANEEGKLLDHEEFGEVIERSDDTDDYDINTTEGTITINGIEYVLYSNNDFAQFDRLGIKRRGRTITSLSELAEYVEAIPAVAAIEIVYDVNGVIKGYRVWVSPRTL